MRLEVEGDDEPGAVALVAKAEETCLVAVSVDPPVTTTVEVHTLGPSLEAASGG